MTLFRVLFIGAVSFFILFILHHMFDFLQQNLTVPVTKDILTKQRKQYRELYNTLDAVNTQQQRQTSNQGDKCEQPAKQVQSSNQLPNLNDTNVGQPKLQYDKLDAIQTQQRGPLEYDTLNGNSLNDNTVGNIPQYSASTQHLSTTHPYDMATTTVPNERMPNNETNVMKQELQSFLHDEIRGEPISYAESGSSFSTI